MGESLRPLVTVTIPMYNNARFIEETIASVLGQSMADFELLIYDDNSTDDSFELAASFTDSRIRLQRNSENLGPEGNWNKAVSSVKGRYVKLVCGDDILYSTCLEKQVERFLEPSSLGVSLVSSQRTIIDSQGKALIKKVNFLMRAQRS